VGPADYIVSGVPLGSMPRWMQLAIALASRDALGDRGELLVYQFTSRVLPVLRETFRDVRRGFEFRNLPPAQYFVCSGAVRTSP
jgi:phospholipid N-methyltransferase